MGCGSSAHTISTSDGLLKSSRATALNSLPMEEVVLKDLPEVVEKVIDVLKETDFKTANSHASQAGILHDSSNVYSLVNAVDSNANTHDTESESSPQGIVQGFLIDNVSTNSEEFVKEISEGHYKLEEYNSTALADVDSLRTSSPESEIEKALANSVDLNPPTPKPTFSELQDLAMIPIPKSNNFGNSENDLISPVGENPKVKQNLNSNTKSEKNIPVTITELTEWEKQADMLANTQKFNPIDAMRKFRNEHRSTSGLPRRGDLKPKGQRYFEDDLSDFFGMENPLQRRLSSARSERGMNANSPKANFNNCETTMQHDLPSNNKKVQEVKVRKPPENKKNDAHLKVLQKGGRGAPSPSLYKVRERCAVCCNKNKH